MKEIEKFRQEIDRIDDKMMDLFVERMELVHAIGIHKKQLGMTVSDPKREKEVLDRLKARLQDVKLWPYYNRFVTHIFLLSKEHQK